MEVCKPREHRTKARLGFVLTIAFICGLFPLAVYTSVLMSRRWTSMDTIDTMIICQSLGRYIKRPQGRGSNFVYLGKSNVRFSNACTSRGFNRKNSQDTNDPLWDWSRGTTWHNGAGAMPEMTCDLIIDDLRSWAAWELVEMEPCISHFGCGFMNVSQLV